MARPPRIELAGGLYHLSTRSPSKRPILSDGEGPITFLRFLARICGSYGWTCHAYCVLTTHYHLLLRIRDANLARGMQRLNSMYGSWFNDVNATNGHVFGGRYGATLVESDAHLLELVRYIALNPVRAQLCPRPEDWPWSSYRSMLGLGSTETFVEAGGLLPLFGTDLVRARQQLRAFVNDRLV